MRVRNINRSRRPGGLAALVLFVWLVTGVAFAQTQAAPGGEARDEARRDEMGSIYDAVQSLLLIALDGDQWADPANRQTIEDALRTLDVRAGKLTAHTGQDSESFGFYSRMLAEGTGHMRSRYADGKYETARFELFQLVDACVACHSRLRTPEDSRLTRGFAEHPRVKQLPLDQRALLQTATRQFEAALESYEALLRSPAYAPSDLDMTGIIDDYLALCFQVGNDPERPAKSLEALLERKPLAPALERDIRGWLAALRALPDPRSRAALAQARGLIFTKEGQERHRSDREALVDYLAAASIAHRIVEDSTRPAEERAEAFYLLGLTESRVGRVVWPAPEEFYLASAIELAPGTDLAGRAFALYEEIMTLGYTGSEGTRLPPEVSARVEKLRALSKTPVKATP